MPSMLAQWLPEHFPPLLALALILCSAFTSMITAALGAGGGVMMLAIMALSMPTAAIIPVHGLVQLGSNANRALMTWRHINLRVIAWFLPGVLIGAWLASRLLVNLPLASIQLSIALFILLLCWGPTIPKVATGRAGTLLASTVTSFLSLFVGATGPLVAAFIKQQQQSKRLQTVATFAAAMTLQHAPKAFAFGAAGFVFHDWLPLVACMIAAGAVGTWAGLRVLVRLGDRNFSLLFNLVLTLLAVRLAWQAIGNWTA
ncbi:MAG: sulfite exporter TauE/SafE family protein [Halopseudomonas sp.]|uniref:sulfite exporter TauE/SafE family protein n=1 Tax=Halopseudomonas sp. TaxID=2901191 RepID=UPI0030016034